MIDEEEVKDEDEELDEQLDRDALENDSSKHYLPYYVRAFLVGVESVLSSARLNSWCNDYEKAVLKIVSEQLSLPALKLLARIQRRRKMCFFRVADLHAKYHKDLGHDCDIGTVVRELEEFQLVRLILPSPAQTEGKKIQEFSSKLAIKQTLNGEDDNKKSTMYFLSSLSSRISLAISANIRCYSSENRVADEVKNSSNEIFDPLLSLFSLPLDDINAIINLVGGALAESIKQSRRLKLSKNQMIKNLIKTANSVSTFLNH